MVDLGRIRYLAGKEAKYEQFQEDAGCGGRITKIALCEEPCGSELAPLRTVGSSTC